MRPAEIRTQPATARRVAFNCLPLYMKNDPNIQPETTVINADSPSNHPNKESTF